MTSKESNVVTIFDKKQDKKIKYYLDSRLKKNFDRIKIELEKEDRDCFIAVDGPEGSGKSTIALQIGKYVDPTLDLSRVVFDAESFRQAIFKAKKRQCIVFDEAFTGLSSRASLSGTNRILISLMMQMRQKNLFVIIVLPTIFLLDKYVAIFRSRTLIHVYESKDKKGIKIRGYFRVYNEKLKKYLFLLGKPTYSYGGSKWKVRTRFRGRFYGVFALGDKEMDKEYREKKAKALEQTEKSPMSAGQVKYREQRDIILYLLRKTSNMTYQQLSNLLGSYDLEMSFVQIRNICAKFGDIEKERDKNGDKSSQKNELTDKSVKNDEKEPYHEIIDDNIDEIDDNDQDNDDFEDNFVDNDDI